MKKNVYLVCNAHLDPVWLWEWREGLTEALSTFRTAADLTDEFPGFIFNHNEALLFGWVKEHEPELFERIKKKVADGTFHIMGGWYLQPDCNMPMGESIIRNIEKGRRFFKENFGVVPTTAINFDSFGHSKGLVQIMNQAGYDSYIICRAGKYSRGPQDFNWKGFNNSSLHVHRSDENYNSILGHAAKELAEFLDKKADEPATMVLWGVGDHGGGPSRKDLADLAAMMKEREDVNIFHAASEDYFKDAAGNGIPFGEDALDSLTPVAEGCYTSQIRVKQKHRLLENSFYRAEKILSAAALQGYMPYPEKELDEVEHDLIFSEFHDALPGSGENLVEEGTLRLIDHGLEILDRKVTSAMIALSAGQAPIIPGTTSVMLYNALPFEATDTFVFECGLPAQNWDDCFYYPKAKVNGVDVPTQYLLENGHFAIDWRKKVAIRATLPASSMSRVDVYWEAIPKHPAYEPIAMRRGFVFDNSETCPEHPMQAVINTSTGLLDSLVVDGKEILTKDSFRLDAYEDTFNPWGIGDRFHHAKRSFRLMTEYEASEFSGLHYITPPIRVIEDGEIQTVVEALFTYDGTNAYVRYTLPKKDSYIGIESGIYWTKRDTYLKLHINTTMEGGKYIGQTICGDQELAPYREANAQKWVVLTDGESAVSVMGDSGYGSSSDGSSINMTVLRSAAYGAAHCGKLRAVEDLRYFERMEQGERIFNWRIDFGRCDQVMENISNKAALFNERPVALPFSPSGKGVAPGKLVTIDNPDVVLMAFKKSHDTDTYRIRVYESAGKDASFKLDIPCKGVSADFTLAPYEIATYVYDPAAGTIEKTGLIEM